MENLQIAAPIVLIVGLLLVVITWFFFRRPGIPLWVARAPVWQAREFLTWPGVVLWYLAIPILLSGIALYVLS